MPSPRNPTPLKIAHPVDVSLIQAHLAGSLGQEKAASVVAAALAALGLPAGGTLAGEQADRVFDQIGLEPGLVGLAAKVARQMVRNQVAPLKPAF